jgi:glycyl-tRNA synthetase
VEINGSANDNIVGLDASILMHPTTWKASGHVDAFNDPLDNKDSKEDIEPTF